MPKDQDAEESEVFILSSAEDLVPVYRKDQNDDWIRNATGNLVIHKLPEVELIVYDCRVRQLFHEVKSSGYRIVQWDGRDDRGHSVASGINFCQIKALANDNAECLFTKVNKMI